MKKTFLSQNRPMLTCMIQTDDYDECLATIKNGIYDGADAFGFQICQFAPKHRTEDTYRYIFEQMAGRPAYITNYRNGFNIGQTDDELMEELLKALECGATLADIMGDTFDKCDGEFTTNPVAVKKQMELADKIHQMGKEVLISTHIHKYTPAEKVIEIALEHQRRGADIVKIVTGASTEEEEIENLRITTLLKKELKVPFLYLSNGSHNKIHRIVGPMLGCAMCLCVQTHNKKSTKAQPLLKTMHEILYCTDYSY